jgi:hypothetical protein
VQDAFHHYRQVFSPKKKVYVSVHQTESIEFASVLLDVFIYKPQELIFFQRIVENKVLKIGNKNDVEKPGLLPRFSSSYASIHRATIKNTTSLIQQNCAEFKGNKFYLKMAAELGCNVHIVLLTENQQDSKKHPRGLKNYNCLTMSQKNNVYVVPYLFLLYLSHEIQPQIQASGRCRGEDGGSA